MSAYVHKDFCGSQVAHTNTNYKLEHTNFTNQDGKTLRNNELSNVIITDCR